MSKKDERLQRVEDMLLQGSLSDEAIAAHVAGEFDVTETTVEKDIKVLRAQDEPLPFYEEPTLLSKLLSNEVDGNGRDDLTRLVEEYEVPEGEEATVHALIEIPTYNNAYPPAKDSSPNIVKLSAAVWETFVKFRTGIKILQVLHLPDGCKPVDQIESYS